MVEWPTAAWINAGLIPRRMRRVTNVWRRLWKLAVGVFPPFSCIAIPARPNTIAIDWQTPSTFRACVAGSTHSLDRAENGLSSSSYNSGTIGSATGAPVFSVRLMAISRRSMSIESQRRLIMSPRRRPVEIPSRIIRWISPVELSRSACTSSSVSARRTWGV